MWCAKRWYGFSELLQVFEYTEVWAEGRRLAVLKQRLYTQRRKNMLWLKPTQSFRLAGPKKHSRDQRLPWNFLTRSMRHCSGLIKRQTLCKHASKEPSPKSKVKCWLHQIPEHWLNWVAGFANLGWLSWIAQIFTLNFSPSVLLTSCCFTRSWGRFSNQLPVSQWQRQAIDLKLRLRAKSKFQSEDTFAAYSVGPAIRNINYHCTIGVCHYKNMKKNETSFVPFKVILV